MRWRGCGRGSFVAGGWRCVAGPSHLRGMRGRSGDGSRESKGGVVLGSGRQSLLLPPLAILSLVLCGAPHVRPRGHQNTSSRESTPTFSCKCCADGHGRKRRGTRKHQRARATPKTTGLRFLAFVLLVLLGLRKRARGAVPVSLYLFLSLRATSLVPALIAWMGPHRSVRQ